MPKVFIVGRDYPMCNMYLYRGWRIVGNIDETVDLIQFTGGEDVDPSYYGEHKHATTYSNPKRDAAEAAIYHEWVGKVPMAGICRGGQFLNVMNGGKLWQNVNNHAIHGTHEAYCSVTALVYQVTSTHHQMMIPAASGQLLLHAAESSVRESASQAYPRGVEEKDTEAVFYPATKSLCFQPHPEYVRITEECQELYFTYLHRFIL